MKAVLAALITLVLGAGCGKKLITDPIVERAIREESKTPDVGNLSFLDLRKVKKLNLYRAQITDAGLKEVAMLQHLSTLHLFRCTKITDAGLKEVAMLQHLSTLHLGDTQITDTGLVELTKCKELEILDLQNTGITDVGFKEVAKLSKLTLLIVTGTKVTKAGVAELQEALPKCMISSPHGAIIPPHESP